MAQPSSTVRKGIRIGGAGHTARSTSAGKIGKVHAWTSTFDGPDARNETRTVVRVRHGDRGDLFRQLVLADIGGVLIP